MNERQTKKENNLKIYNIINGDSQDCGIWTRSGSENSEWTGEGVRFQIQPNLFKKNYL
jgi:hypothetical protein